jgi:cytoskeleton protein RodZ
MARRAANEFAEDSPEQRSDLTAGRSALPTGRPIAVGERLRATREDLGIELRDVSETLRIRYDHLLAIEERRYGALPAPVYAIGFIRSYAAFLDLDADQAVRDFKAETAMPDARAPKRQRSGPVPDRAAADRPAVDRAVSEGPVEQGAGRSVRWLWAVAALAVIVAIGGWEFFLASREAAIVEQPAPAEVAEQPAEPMTEATEPALSSTQERVSLEPVPAVPEPTPEVRSHTGGLQPLADERIGAGHGADARMVDEDMGAAADEGPATEDETAGEGGLASLTGSVEPLVRPGTDPNAALMTDSSGPGDVSSPSASPSSAARVVLHATSDSWVQVRDSSDSLIMTRVLRAGDTYQVPPRRGLILVTGNAGGLEVVVDGRTIPPLGPRGAVRRNVSLDPDSLLARSQQE